MDYSIYANSPRFSFADLVIGATTTQFTSAANPAGKNMVGNLVNVASGTGFTVQFVEIVSVSGTTATCDKSLGTAASTGGTGKLGGGLATLTKLAATMAPSNKAFVSSGNYAGASLVTFGQAGVTPGPGVSYSRLIGYAVRRGDITAASANQSSRPNALTTTLNAGVLAFTNSGWQVENLIVGPSGVATCGAGVTFGAFYATILNCKVSSCTGRAITLPSASVCHGCEVTGCNSDVTVIAGTQSLLSGCWLHGNTASLGVVYCGNNADLTVAGNLISDNSGSGPGIYVFMGRTIVLGNTVHASGGNGITAFASALGTGQLAIRGNLLTGNGGYGLASGIAGAPASLLWDGNAYWNNTSGTRHNMDDTSTSPVSGVAPYTNTLDVVLTANPFVNSALNDFRLNAVAGGGADCRGHGVPQSWPGNSATVGSPDMGAVQHSDAPNHPVRGRLGNPNGA